MVSTGESVNEPPEQGKIRQWIINHDDSWWFIVPYIGLAVILSIVLSLFWLVMVVLVHVLLELARQWMAKPDASIGAVISRTLWEVKLDIGLVLFALVLALYMELALGVLGLGHATRAGALAGSRVLVFQRVLRAILMSLDDMALLARAVMARGKGKNDEETEQPEIEVPESGWGGHWSRGDYFSIGFGVISFLLIVFAPIITHHDVETTLETLAQELQPFPEEDLFDEFDDAD